MSVYETFPCKLANFEGPLDYLLYLVQQGEIVLAELPLFTLTQQFVDRCEMAAEPPLETSAEFVGAAATLMWLKSKLLLPRSLTTVENEAEAAFEIRLEALQQLVDYYALKRTAGFLSRREEEQHTRHCRGYITQETPEERSLGLEVGLEELTRLFEQALKRSSQSRGTVQSERWQVSQAIAALKKRLTAGVMRSLATLFTPQMCRGEVIVTFLAVLELMKDGHLVIHDDGTCHQVTS